MITHSTEKLQQPTKDLGLIPVVARLALATPAARTYYKLKFLDKQGQGFITIDPNEFCSEMGYTRSTMYRHLNNTKLFRCVSRPGENPRQWLRNADGTITVYMCSISKAMKAYGHQAMGAVFLMSAIEVASPWAIKCRSAEAVVKQGQRQAYYSLCQSFKGKGRYTVISDHEVIHSYTKKERSKQKDSQIMGGANEGQSRLYRLNHGQYAGAKSATNNAKELDRSVDTLRRYLDNDTRSKVHIEPMQSRRLIRKLSEAEEFRANAFSHFISQSHNIGFSGVRSPHFFPLPVQADHTRKKEKRSSVLVGRFTIGSEAPRFYEMLPKIYGTEITLLKYKTHRRKLFHLLEGEALSMGT